MIVSIISSSSNSDLKNDIENEVKSDEFEDELDENVDDYNQENDKNYNVIINFGEDEYGNKEQVEVELWQIIVALIGIVIIVVVITIICVCYIQKIKRREKETKMIDINGEEAINVQPGHNGDDSVNENGKKKSKQNKMDNPKEPILGQHKKKDEHRKVTIEGNNGMELLSGNNNNGVELVHMPSDELYDDKNKNKNKNKETMGKETKGKETNDASSDSDSDSVDQMYNQTNIRTTKGGHPGNPAKIHLPDKSHTLGDV